MNRTAVQKLEAQIRRGERAALLALFAAAMLVTAMIIVVWVG